MPIFLNAFPLKIPDINLDVCVIPYDDERLKDLREKHQTTHVFRRRGDNILILSHDGQYPVTGCVETVCLKDNFDILCFLVKDGLKRYLNSLNRQPTGFNPIELVIVLKQKIISFPQSLGRNTPLKSALNTKSTHALLKESLA